MSNDRYWEEMIQGDVDNELTPADRLAVEKYLDDNPEAKKNMEYLTCLKRRLKAHGETISIPKTVNDRIIGVFEKKRKIYRRPWFVGTGLGLAAALVIGFLAPNLVQTPYHFEDGAILLGKAVCHDCTVAARAGIEKGILCTNGHRLGLEAEDGTLWRFADDSDGQRFVKDLTLIGQKVQVFGQTLKRANLIRVRDLERVDDQHAALHRHRILLSAAP